MSSSSSTPRHTYSDAETTLLTGLHRELEILTKAQLAFPMFGTAITGALFEAAVKATGLAVVQSEQVPGSPADLRSQQLEHLMAAITEAFTAEMRFLDDHPDLVRDLLNGGVALRTIALRAAGKGTPQ